MSGTDYTLTTNYGLFKPLPSADINQWGSHLNLNADTLDGLLHGFGGSGPFLPLAMPAATAVAGTGTLPNQVIFDFLAASAAKPSQGSQLNGYLVDQSTGGSFSDMYCNARFDCTMQGSSSTGITGVLSQMTYNGTGGSAGYVPFYGQTSRKTVNAGGSAQNPQIWGAVFEVIDWTNTDSAQTNFMSGIEIDMTCGNTDSATSRRALGIYLNYTNPTDVPPVCNCGIHIAANSGSYNVPLRIQTPYNTAAIDLSLSVKNSGAHTIWMASGGDVAWDTAGTKLTYWDTAANAGAGGVHTTANMQVDGSLLVLNTTATTGYTNLLLLEENSMTPGAACVLRLGRDFINNYNSGYLYYQMNATAAQSTVHLGMFGTVLDHLILRADGVVLAPNLPGSTTYANDAAAATGGVIVGQLYRNGSAIMVRVA